MTYYSRRAVSLTPSNPGCSIGSVTARSAGGVPGRQVHPANLATEKRHGCFCQPSVGPDCFCPVLLAAQERKMGGCSLPLSQLAPVLRGKIKLWGGFGRPLFVSEFIGHPHIASAPRLRQESIMTRIRVSSALSSCLWQMASPIQTARR